MNLNIFESFFANYNSNLKAFVSKHPHIKFIKQKGVEYLKIDKNVGTDEIFQLLTLLREEKLEITFHDTVHPTTSDPGAYFSYSTKKSVDDKHWAMTYGNHGWSGGIYQIMDFIVARQIISLIKKEEINRIQISNVVFFSHYEVKTEEESRKKGNEIQAMHRKMTTREIINRISSRDSHQIWESSCEIIALGQYREKIKPLLGLTDKIDDLTKGIELGGAFAPNSRFVSGAIRTLKFHRDSDACTCALYGLHDCMDPNQEVEKGFLKIDNVIRMQGGWVDYYEASCTRCGQKFRIEERQGHYVWWGWIRKE